MATIQAHCAPRSGLANGLAPRLRSMTSRVNQRLSRFDIAVTRRSSVESLRRKARQGQSWERDRELLLALPENKLRASLSQLGRSRSQLRQDLFVLSQLDFKTGGYFVEFGATNGVDLSNTFLLEQEYGWTGVLAEPARIWHDDLHRNRRCQIDTRCVWSHSDRRIEFIQPEDAELSTIGEFQDGDRHAEARANAKRYEVETTSLMDLLETHDAPREIDYLSIDTEGSELEILERFDFDRYDIKVITCEHNYTNNRPYIHELLAGKGYTRRMEELSRFDDWYVRI